MKRDLLIPLACGLLLAGCADKTVAPTPAVPGVLTVSLSTPHDNDRALLISVSGPEALSGVHAASSAYTAHHRGSGTGFRAALFGPLATGPLLRFGVPDVNRVSQYTASLVEVSDDRNQVRASTDGYALTVAR